MPLANGLVRWISIEMRRLGVTISSCLSNMVLTCERTGMKCLPRSKIADARGSILHDCHAEIVALRAFNRYLIDECAIFTHEPPAISDVVERRDVDQVTERYPQPFAIRRDVSIHMYCSEAPCGDASMELIMQAQDDATPWEVPQTTTSDDDESIGEVPVDLKGRGYFSELGIVRKKPGTLYGQFLQLTAYKC